MALFFISFGAIARSEGASIVCAAMYNAAENGKCERTGERFNFKNKKSAARVVEKFMRFPPGALEMTRLEFANLCEAAEGDRKAARTGRRIMVSLDNDLPAEKWKDLAIAFVDKNFTRRGLVADVSIHSHGKNSDGNPHLHIIIPTRLSDGADGGLSKKKFDELNKQSFLRGMRDSWSRLRNEARAEAKLAPDDSRAKTDAARAHFVAERAKPLAVAARREVFANSLEEDVGENFDRKLTRREIAEMCEIAAEESPRANFEMLRRETRAVAREMSPDAGITVRAVIWWMRELARAAWEIEHGGRSEGM